MLTFSFLKLYAKMKFKFFNSFKKKSYKPYKIKFEFLKFINLISLPIKQHFKMHTINKMRKHYFNRDRATINHQPINRKFVKRKRTTVTKIAKAWSANRLINRQATVMSGSIEIPLRDTDEVSKEFSLWMHKRHCWSTSRDKRVRKPSFDVTALFYYV